MATLEEYVASAAASAQAAAAATVVVQAVADGIDETIAVLIAPTVVEALEDAFSSPTFSGIVTLGPGTVAGGPYGGYVSGNTAQNYHSGAQEAVYFAFIGSSIDDPQESIRRVGTTIKFRNPANDGNADIEAKNITSTGIITTTTAAAGTNTTQVATTAFVATAISNALGVHVPLALPSGQWAGNHLSYNSGGSLAVTANMLRFAPFLPMRDITIDRLSINVTAAGASGATAALAVYDADASTLKPTLKLAETAAFATTTTGIKENTITPSTLTLKAGKLYFLAILGGATAPGSVQVVAAGSGMTLGFTAGGLTIRTGYQYFPASLPSDVSAATLTDIAVSDVWFRLRIS